MYLITKKKRVALLGVHKIYEIQETLLVPLEISNSKFAFFKDDETKYKEIFLSFDITRDFYFSYTYDLTQTLQINHAFPTRSEDKFLWNSFLLDPAINAGIDRNWLIPIIHGFIGQKHFVVNGREIFTILIARRSRFFAGTRYLKRGINDDGNVANYVETEQIVYDLDSLTTERTLGNFTSFVQLRGSIPIFWSQTISTKVVNPKPDIHLGKFDPQYDAAKHHFNRLFARHGPIIVCLDLIRQNERHPRESTLGEPYKQCIDYLNQQLIHSIELIQWDLKEKSKKQSEFLYEMNEICENVSSNISFFSITKTSKKDQLGVIRTNCIDCLDRTNVVQAIIGKFVFTQQLVALGVLSSNQTCPIGSWKEAILDDLYEELGNRIAIQYGGSNMVSAGIKNKSVIGDILNSVTRYYKNNFSDENKQNSINLFLGNFMPIKEKIHLWELESDSYLHLGDESQLGSTKNSFGVVPSPLSSTKVKRSNKSLKIEVSKLKKDEFFEELYHVTKYSSMEDLMKVPSMQTDSKSLFVVRPTQPTVKHEVENIPRIFEYHLEVDPKDLQMYQEYFKPIHPSSFVSHKEEFVFILEAPFATTFTPYKPQVDVISEFYSKFTEDPKNIKMMPEDPYLALVSKYFHHFDDQVLIEFIQEMKKAICIKDRVKQTAVNGRIQEKMVKACFVGQDAIDWVLKQSITVPIRNRENAMILLNVLLVGQVFHHVDHRSTFEDDSHFYRFFADDEIRVLNIHQTYLGDGNLESPGKLAQNLMEKISLIYNQILASFPSQNKFQFNRVFDNATKILSSSEYQEFLILLIELQKTDLSMTKEKERVLFWINIFNILFLHGALELNQGDLSHARGEFYRNTCYRIGRFEFSLYDIKHGVLRGNKKSFGCLLNTFDKSKHHWAISKENVDPRANFVLCQSNHPILKAFESLDCLNEASRQYFLQNTRTRAEVMILPKLLHHYKEDFVDIKETIIKSLQEDDELKPRVIKTTLIEYK